MWFFDFVSYIMSLTVEVNLRRKLQTSLIFSVVQLDNFFNLWLPETCTHKQPNFEPSN